MSDYLGPEFYSNLSRRLSSALDDCGCTWETVMRRRKSFLQEENLKTIHYRVNGHNIICFHFGSQSEGTTTPGLQSDTDLLHLEYDINVIQNWDSWKPGDYNLLMLKESSFPPQQYLLMLTKNTSREPETLVLSELLVCRWGKILFASERMLNKMERTAKSVFNCVFKGGPSVSGAQDYDVVHALCVFKTMPEIEHWIARGRPGHWPTPALFEAARKCICFLVPAGLPGSDTKREEWRLSPNLVERMLMFSLNITQLKCYVVLKIMKKTFFQNVVQDGITSFHCKTVLMYTIERIYGRLWKDHNLISLIMACLQTLRRWLKCYLCPHYILPGVNLFDGKLTFTQCRQLHSCVTSLINTFPQALFQIQIDRLGERLSPYIKSDRSDDERLGSQLNMTIRRKLDLDRLKYADAYDIIHDQPASSSEMIQSFLVALHTLRKLHLTGNRMEKRATRYFERFIFSWLSSVQASLSIQIGNTVSSAVLECYKYSFNTDIASSRLKLASMMLSSGHLHSAAYVLGDVEDRCSVNFRYICCCGRSMKRDMSLDALAEDESDDIQSGYSESNIALCVRFRRQEAYCVPPVLLFEMDRSMSEEEVSVKNDNKLWMNDACVDVIPFLYYLQYLTYDGLGDRNRQLLALRALGYYINEHCEDVYHPETCLNLLGHCLEMEDELEMAVDMYVRSLTLVSQNNAANWHLARVLDSRELEQIPNETTVDCLLFT